MLFSNSIQVDIDVGLVDHWINTSEISWSPCWRRHHWRTLLAGNQKPSVEWVGESLVDQWEPEETEPDGLLSDSFDAEPTINLKKVLQVCVGVLVSFPKDGTTLYHHDQWRLELEIHVSGDDSWASGHIGKSRWSWQIVDGLVGHDSVEQWYVIHKGCIRWWEGTWRRDNLRSNPSQACLWILLKVCRQVETNHALPFSVKEDSAKISLLRNGQLNDNRITKILINILGQCFFLQRC